MNLYDRSVDVDLRLQSMRQQDSSLDLVAKADHMVEVLDEVSTTLDSLQIFRSVASITTSPSMDRKPVTAAIRAFRAGVSRHGPKAFQQQPAAKLIDAAKEYRSRCVRWSTSQWKSLFVDVRPMLEASEPGKLGGDSIHRRNAERLARRIGMLERQDPLVDLRKIEADLLQGDTVVGWRDRLRELAGELGDELDALQRERDALTPEVKQVLQSASSGDGFGLENLTPDILQKLTSAGVATELVVRRR